MFENSAWNEKENEIALSFSLDLIEGEKYVQLQVLFIGLYKRLHKFKYKNNYLQHG